LFQDEAHGAKSPASVVLPPSRRYIKVVVAFGPRQSAGYGYRAPALDELV
jgi:hypothetical protein